MEKVCVWGAKGEGLSNANDCLPGEKSVPGNSAVRAVPWGRTAGDGLCRLKQAFDDKLSARC